MKIGVIISSITLAFVIVGAVMLANLNTVNLLLSGSSSSTSPSSQFNVNGEEEEPYNPTKVEEATGGNLNEMLQSGLAGGGVGGNKLNLLWVLQNAKDPDTSSYAFQLLSAYANLESGKYNDLTHHISPDAMAGSHFNETSLTSFLVPSVSGFGKATGGNLGKSVGGKTLTLENAMKSDIQNSGGSVWKDANGDGQPDGPFQIEEGNKGNENANKARGDGKYDLYNFIDAANVVDGKYNAIASKVAEGGGSVDPRALSALFGMYHNRGASGVGRMLYGMPYTNKSGKIKYGDFMKNQTLESMSPSELNTALKFPSEFMKWFDATNMPLENVVGSVNQTRGLASLLILSKGGFFNGNVSPTTKSAFESLPNDIIANLFPGKNKSNIVDHINKNHVKKPWDVLNMTKAKYDKIYGSSAITNQYEEIYRFDKNWYNTIFYIDKEVKSDIYKAGNNVVVRAIEGIAAGYMIDVGVAGTYVLLEIALEAGIKSLTDGTIVDPTNPQTLYQKLAPESSGQFNPASAASGNFGKFLDELGLTGTLSETQQLQIKALYEVAGGKYSMGLSYGYSCDRGEFIKGGPERCIDCSGYATVGLFLDPELKANRFQSTSTISSGVWLKSKAKTKEHNGKTYDAKVVQLDGKGNPMAESTSLKKTKAYSKKDWEWMPYVQAGDIINVGGSPGHVIMFLGQNKTDKTMVLSPDVSKTGPKLSTHKPGGYFIMHASGTHITYGGDKMGLAPMSADWGERKKRDYQAMRPIYNVR